MFFRSKPTCPIDPDAERWVADSMRWLMDELGRDAMRSRPVMTMTPEFFPNRIELTPESARDAFERVAHHMGLNASLIGLEFYNESGGSGMEPGSTFLMPPRPTTRPYETDERPTVWLEVGRCAQSVSMIAAMAHELAQLELTRGGHLKKRRDDREALIDLATVYYGLGVFNANAVIVDIHWSDGVWAGWSGGTTSYLGEQTFAYALALFAHFRDERRPEWARALRPTLLGYFKKSARWIETNGGPPD